MPLHIACACGRVDVVTWLIENKSKLNLCDNENRSSLMKDGFTPMLLAVSAKHHEMAELLLEQGVNVNATDKTGRTAQIFAASDGQVDIVKLLFDHGIDASLKEKEGQTAKD